MYRSFLIILLLFVFSCSNRSESFSIVWHKLQKLMKIHPRTNFDRSKCALRPKKLYGHFIDSKVYPDEIHSFFINHHNSQSDKALGKNLQLITRRILKLDPKYTKRSKPFTVYRVDACIPNENVLRPSWE